MRRSLFVAIAVSIVAVSVVTPAAASDGPRSARCGWTRSTPGCAAPADIDDLIASAQCATFNTIVAQVRRNAQVAVRRAAGRPGSRTTCRRRDSIRSRTSSTKAHAKGIEVHAWANIGAVLPGQPGRDRHRRLPVRACPATRTISSTRTGASIRTQPVPPILPPIATEDIWLTRAHPSFLAGTTSNGYRQSPSGVWFLDLGHPAAAQHTLDVLLDILRDYDVDGIHLDYIRYPEMPIAAPRPPGVGLPFSIGYNPTSVARFNAAFDKPAGSLPDPWDADFTRWRRDQVTAFVRRLYLEMNFSSRRRSSPRRSSPSSAGRTPSSRARSSRPSRITASSRTGAVGWTRGSSTSASRWSTRRSTRVARRAVPGVDRVHEGLAVRPPRRHRPGPVPQLAGEHAGPGRRRAAPRPRRARSRAGFNFFSYQATNVAIPSTRSGRGTSSSAR